jgi:hypothetical protein
MAYALDNTPQTTALVVITGDRDFAYAISMLQNRGYRVVAIVPTASHASVRANASTVVDWTSAILKPVFPVGLMSPAKKSDVVLHSQTDVQIPSMPLSIPLVVPPSPSTESSALSVEALSIFSEEQPCDPVADVEVHHPPSPTVVTFHPASAMPSFTSGEIPPFTDGQIYFDPPPALKKPTPAAPTLTQPSSSSILPQKMALSPPSLDTSAARSQLLEPIRDSVRRDLRHDRHDADSNAPVLNISSLEDMFRRAAPILSMLPENSAGLHSSTPLHTLPTTDMNAPTAPNRSMRSPPVLMQQSGSAARPPSDTIAVASHFIPLVDVLNKMRCEDGLTEPLWSAVASALNNKPATYRRAGVARFGEYVELAVKDGIVSIGGAKPPAGARSMILNARLYG